MSGPDFLVIGAMKCGTSTVCAYCEDHPDIFMMPNSEPRFFSHDAHFERGTAWYEQIYFRSRGSERVAGEGSNDYTSLLLYPRSVERIRAYNPDMKLIYVVRHPVQRIVSSWVQHRGDALDNAPATLDMALRDQADFYLGPSLYGDTLRQYHAAFGADQICVCFMEDLKADPQGFFRRICNFLGVDLLSDIKRGHQNKGRGKRIPSPLYTRLNHLPGMRFAKKLMPTQLKHTVRRNVLSQKIPSPPRFNAQSMEILRAQIAPDMQHFLAQQGKPADFWTLDDY